MVERSEPKGNLDRHGARATLGGRKGREKTPDSVTRGLENTLDLVCAGENGLIHGTSEPEQFDFFSFLQFIYSSRKKSLTNSFIILIRILTLIKTIINIRIKGGCNMAQDKEKDGKVVVSLWIDKELVNKLDSFADKVGITRSKILSNIIEAAVHDLGIMEKTGVLSIAKFYLDIREAIKSMGTTYKDKKILTTIMNDKRK